MDKEEVEFIPRISFFYITTASVGLSTYFNPSNLSRMSGRYGGYGTIIPGGPLGYEWSISRVG